MKFSRNEQSNPEKNRKRSVHPGMPIVLGILSFFCIASLIGDTGFAQTYSPTERRKLASLPKMDVENVLDGSGGNALERYTTDHVFGREELLRVNAWMASGLYGSKEQNGLIAKEGKILSVQRKIDKKSLDHARDVFSLIYETDLKDTQCALYDSIVPDKSYFLKTGEYLNMDYEAYLAQAQSVFSFASEIPIASTLSLDDYYATDPHWRQEAILEQARTIATAMGVKLAEDFTEETIRENFTAQQGLQSVWPHKGDTLKVLKSPSMSSWTIWRYDEKGKRQGTLYDRTKAEGEDPYSVFLSGSAGMIEIENPDGPKDRQLVLFADSYGSSMAPLLATGYSRTTIIDLRNLPSFRLKSMIDFSRQDVLFLYSTSVLNASYNLK